MTPGEEKFYSPREDLETLSENIVTLNTSIAVLDASISTLSSKYVTPANIADVVTGYAVKFALVVLSTSDTIPIDTGHSYRGLACDGVNYYSYNVDRDVIEKFKPGDASVTDFATPTFPVEAMCWNSDDNQLICAEEWSNNNASHDARILVYESDGTLTYTKTLSNSISPTISNLLVWGLAYDSDNQRVFVVYSKSDTVTRYGQVDVTDGSITSTVNISDVFHWYEDAEYLNGILFIKNESNIVGFRIGDATPIVWATPPSAPSQYFSVDKINRVWSLLTEANDYFNLAGFAHVTRIAIEDVGSDLDGVETHLDGIETLLEGTAKVKVWDGIHTLDIDAASKMPISSTQLTTIDGVLDAIQALLEGTAKVKLWDGTNTLDVDADSKIPISSTQLATLEETLTNLEKALQSINTDYLKVQHRDGAGNLMPSMDAAARAGFQKMTDGTYVCNFVISGRENPHQIPGILSYGFNLDGVTARLLPVAAYSDALANKGYWVVPVTPMTGQREEGTKTHTNDACFVVSYEVTAVEAKTGYVLIDLSNATNYPHTLTSEIHVDWLAFSMLGDVSCEGHVHIGFISAIDADKGTMISFVCKPADKIARASFVSRQYNPSAVRCKTAGVLAGGGMKIVDDTTFQNDVALAGTYEAVIPAVGDLVMLIDRVAGTFDTVSVAIGYHTI